MPRLDIVNDLQLSPPPPPNRSLPSTNADNGDDATSFAALVPQHADDPPPAKPAVRQAPTDQNSPAQSQPNDVQAQNASSQQSQTADDAGSNTSTQQASAQNNDGTEADQQTDQSDDTPANNQVITLSQRSADKTAALVALLTSVSASPVAIAAVAKTAPASQGTPNADGNPQGKNGDKKTEAANDGNSATQSQPAANSSDSSTAAALLAAASPIAAPNSTPDTTSVSGTVSASVKGVDAVAADVSSANSMAANNAGVTANVAVANASTAMIPADKDHAASIQPNSPAQQAGVISINGKAPAKLQPENSLSNSDPQTQATPDTATADKTLAQKSDAATIAESFSAKTIEHGIASDKGDDNSANAIGKVDAGVQGAVAAPRDLNQATAIQLPQTATAAADAPRAPIAIERVPFEIAASAHKGAHEFEIRLDPPDLGRVDVSLSVDKGGKVQTHLVVERADTLDQLRRDAPNLERALQNSGLKTDAGSLQFSLRGQSQQNFTQDQSQAGNFRRGVAQVALSAGDEATLQGGWLGAGSGNGLDLRI